MFNKVILQANLTRDIELRYTGSGSAIAKLGLAVNDEWKDRNTGEKKKDVMYIDANVFGRAAEVANLYLSRGSKVLISGRLVMEQWQDNNGQKRSKHSIKVESFDFLDSRGEAPQQDSHNEAKSNAYQPQDDDGQDIPF